MHPYIKVAGAPTYSFPAFDPDAIGPLTKEDALKAAGDTAAAAAAAAAAEEEERAVEAARRISADPLPLGPNEW